MGNEGSVAMVKKSIDKVWNQVYIQIWSFPSAGQIRDQVSARVWWQNNDQVWNQIIDDLRW